MDGVTDLAICTELHFLEETSFNELHLSGEFYC